MLRVLTRVLAYEVLVVREACKSIKDELRRVVSSVVKGSLVAAFGVLVFGTVFSLDRALGLMAPPVFALLYFFWKMLVIPSKLHGEHERRKKNAELASELAEEFSKGQKLLRRHAGLGEQMAWIDEYDEWCEQVSEKLKTIGGDQAFMFDRHRIL